MNGCSRCIRGPSEEHSLRVNELPIEYKKKTPLTLGGRRSVLVGGGGRQTADVNNLNDVSCDATAFSHFSPT